MQKAAPVVIRQKSGQIEILAFLHPLAGKQFVKGTIEVGESLEAACERELFEESGINASVIKNLGAAYIEHHKLNYGFCLMNTDQNLPDSFDHYCEDDGGHVFSFFWQPLNKDLDGEWHPIFHEMFQALIEQINPHHE
jgi:8-oxo-dGTP pyrophosphatase MutT (NUDIX family)